MARSVSVKLLRAPLAALPGAPPVLSVQEVRFRPVPPGALLSGRSRRLPDTLLAGAASGRDDGVLLCALGREDLI